MFSDILKMERIKAGLTQAELGQKLGISQQAIGKWENGIAEPDIASISKLCDIFGCTTSYLLCKTDDPTQHTRMDKVTPAKARALAERISQLSEENQKKALDYLELLENKRNK